MPDPEEPVFQDFLFRNKKRRHGYRVIAPPQPLLEAPIADTHAHLDMLDDVSLALARSAAYGVKFIGSMVDIYEDPGKAYDCLDTWYAQTEARLPELIANTEAALEQAAAEGDQVPDLQLPDHYELPKVRPVVGCHPHHAKHYDAALEKRLLERLHDESTCALGEVGLDYHYDFSPRPVQREAFRRQVQLAHKTGLPLVLHLREAHDDALEIMEEEGFPEAGTLLHCFNLDAETLAPWVAHDCYIAFGGPVTFKKSDETRAAVRTVPLKRLLTETDAPFMTPEPLRGMTCGPEHTVFTAEILAQVFEASPGKAREEFLGQLYQNALDLLDRKPTLWQQSTQIQ